MEQILSILTVILCAFVLVITIISHMSIKNGQTMEIAKAQIRHAQRDTLGRKLYRYLIILFCLNGFFWGWAPATYIFLFAAILTERLIVYRICRENQDGVGRFLAKIDW